MPAGRPSEFTPEAANEICERLAKGESLRSICADEEAGWLPSERTVFRWLEANTEFRQQYVHAREVQAETLVDQIIDIADCKDRPTDEEMLRRAEAGEVVMRDHNRDRLRVEARKWVASKLAPKKYGEKIAHVGGDEDDAPIRVQRVERVIVRPPNPNG